MNTKTTWALIVLLIIIIIVGVVYATGKPADASADVRDTVTSFGMHMQEVSLLAPDVSTTIAGAYAPYVSTDLLAMWEEAPMQAPGRVTSSPWPDRIEVSSVAKQDDDTYVVTGTVVEATSTGDAGSYPVTITVAQEDGTWKITQFSGYPTAGMSGMASSTEATSTPEQEASTTTATSSASTSPVNL